MSRFYLFTLFVLPLFALGAPQAEHVLPPSAGIVLPATELVARPDQCPGCSGLERTSCLRDCTIRCEDDETYCWDICAMNRNCD